MGNKRETTQEMLDRLLIMGVPIDGNDAEHFFMCARCHKPVDMRDLGEVFFHEHAEDAA